MSEGERSAPLPGLPPSRREFLRRMGVAGLAAASGSLLDGCLGAMGDGQPPNVVLIFTDDQGYGDVGVYGARGFATPHLDRMAAEGMRFTDFYASQGVCSASRASLLTGCYAERVSILGALGPGAEIGLNPREETLAELLRDKGYATAIVGKWHLGHHEEFLPLQQGFDEYLGLPYSNDMWPVNYDGTPATDGGQAGYPPLPLMEGNRTIEIVEDLGDQDRLTTRYTERAVDFIDRHARSPFFLYLAHSMPHVPLGVAPGRRGSSEQGMYGDVIQEIDGSVGQVLEALDRNGIAERTLVIFTSDNGPWLNFGNHAGSAGPLREGKGTAFEGGPRVPAIWRWPGHIPPGSVYRGLASTLDILPTVVAVVGAEPPASPIDGVSIVPVLEGHLDAHPRASFLFYYDAELRGVREGKWKRVFGHRTRSYEGVVRGRDGLPGPYAFPTVPAALYDLEVDIAETTDLSAGHPEVVARLDALAEEARAALGDRLTGRTGSEVRPPGRRMFDRPDTVRHLAVGAGVSLAMPPSPSYPGSGASTLTDGLLGSRDHRDGRWLGFSGDDLDATVDLGTPRAVARVGLGCLQAQGPWIFLPRWVEVSGSTDGSTWRMLGRVEVEDVRDPEVRVVRVEVPLVGGGARYLRVRAGNRGPLPEWHPGSPAPAWLFVEEIVVEGG